MWVISPTGQARESLKSVNCVKITNWDQLFAVLYRPKVGCEVHHGNDPVQGGRGYDPRGFSSQSTRGQ